MTGDIVETPVFRYLIAERRQDDPRSAGYLKDAQALGFGKITFIVCSDLYFIKGNLSESEQQFLGQSLLADPISQTFTHTKFTSPKNQKQNNSAANTWTVEVALLPGVTDDVALQIKRAAHVLGIQSVEEASTGFHFEILGDNLSGDDIASLIKRLLSNPVIQRAAIGEIMPLFPDRPAASGQVETLNLLDVGQADLLKISQDRRAALDLAEMQAIQQYFKNINRQPTDVEFEMIAQTWSEHCVHKTFSAKVSIQEADGTQSEVDNLLKTYLRSATQAINAPWVLSAFVDNAGIIVLDDLNEISFKVETHNHPSAIEPFGGANTGIGGVIRDIIGVSAKPIAATDILCFGPQDLPVENLAEGVLHPRRIQSGVVAGIEDYGNKIGIPTVNGAVLYDDGYTANPLVYCGCVGLAPRGSHPNAPTPGDKIVVLGGATGRDGLRGATFSSMTMDAQTGEVSGASVQIGAPIIEKGLIDVLMLARDQKLYTAITDCGAGGLSSAIGEMVKHLGADIALDKAPLKYPGLAAWEIWLSEAQERMVIAVPEQNLPVLMKICQLHEVDCTVLGEFRDDGQLIITHDGNTVLDLSLDFLHNGIPQRHLSATIASKKTTDSVCNQHTPQEIKQIALDLLSHPNIASKEAIVRVYDHEIMGGTAVKPLVGVQAHGPSDACVIKPIGTQSPAGFVLSNGINPWYGQEDAYAMAFAVIDEAVRNAVAVGADPTRIAILDNFCWGDPTNQNTMGSLIQALRGCHDAAIRYGTPFISGKDSLNNEYLGNDGKKHAIPPSLLISAIGVIDDVNRTITMDFKEPENVVYLLGKLQGAFGGSHYTKVTGEIRNNQVPNVPDYTEQLYKTIYEQIQAGVLQSCHDLSEGGLIVAAAEMCLGGELGLSIQKPEKNLEEFLFSETTAAFLVEITPQQESAFLDAFDSIPKTKIGAVTKSPAITIEDITISLDEIRCAWLRSEA